MVSLLAIFVDNVLVHDRLRVEERRLRIHEADAMIAKIRTSFLRIPLEDQVHLPLRIRLLAQNPRVLTTTAL